MMPLAAARAPTGRGDGLRADENAMRSASERGGGRRGAVGEGLAAGGAAGGDVAVQVGVAVGAMAACGATLRF